MEQITIQGLDFNVESPYEAGHVINEGEASALNQVLHENLRNNFAKTVKAAKEAAGDDPVDIVELQTKLDEYAAKYAFGVRTSSGPRTTVDPVTREALSLAKEAIRAAAKAKGVKLDKEQLEELASNLIEKKPEFRAAAEERVAQKRAITETSLDSLGL